MRASRRSIWLALPILLSTLSNGGAPLEDGKSPAITKNKSTYQEQVVDLANPPAAIKDKLKGHLGYTDCVYSLNWNGLEELRSKRTIPDGIEANVVISKLDATLDLKITVYLPTAASPALKDHEAGHRRIGERTYETADAEARRLAQAKIGKPYTGKGATEDAARAAAMKKAGDELVAEYLAAVEAEGQRVHDIYDQLTDHGSKPVPTVDDAIRQAFETRKKQKTSGGH